MLTEDNGQEGRQDPFNGRGPLNLTPLQLQQLVALAAWIKYQELQTALREIQRAEAAARGED